MGPFLPRMGGFCARLLRWRRSLRQAEWFSQYPAGQVVGLQMGNNPAWPETLLGLWKAGHVALPLDFDLSGDRLLKARCRLPDVPALRGWNG